MRRSSRKVSQADHELLAELRYQLRRFASFSEQAAHEAGVTPTQHQALLAIKGARSGLPIPVRELAERLCIRHHSAVGLVNRLIARGYARRTQDSADRRRVLLSLSRGGERVLEGLSGAHRDELLRIGPHIKSLLERLRRRG